MTEYAGRRIEEIRKKIAAGGLGDLAARWLVDRWAKVLDEIDAVGPTTELTEEQLDAANKFIRKADGTGNPPKPDEPGWGANLKQLLPVPAKSTPRQATK
jgi:hypothetical protein